MRRYEVGLIEKRTMAASEAAIRSMESNMPCAAWRGLKEMGRYSHGEKN